MVKSNDIKLIVFDMVNPGKEVISEDQSAHTMTGADHCINENDQI